MVFLGKFYEYILLLGHIVLPQYAWMGGLTQVFYGSLQPASLE